MKNTRFTSIFSSHLIACALLGGLLASAHSASAQSSTPLVVVDIPFPFQTETLKLPAGRYHIVRESYHLIRLQGPGSGAGVLAVANVEYKIKTPDHTSLFFDHYGDKYFLREIWRTGETAGVECPKGPEEKLELQANNKQAPSTIELALSSPPNR